MAFGAIIATGSGNSLLSRDLAECLIEVRVEQTLDAPARFGIRVREDISGGQPMAAGSTELKPDTVITIAVPGKDGLVCLARGPVTDSQSQYTLGGPGSWFEVHGQDRLIEMGRQCVQYAWEGKASDAARRLLGSNNFTPDIQDTDRSYGRSTETLNQRGTDLDFLTTAARENGFFLWVTCDATLAGSVDAGGSLTVVETAHFKSSPTRSLGAGGMPASATSITLAPTGGPVIRAGAGSECANNVTRFEVREDVERPNAATVNAVDTTSVRQESATPQDQADALPDGGQRLKDVSGLERTLGVTAAGNASDVRGRAAAALSESGWFLTATASTTAHMLGGLLRPHDVVEVQGIGSAHSIPFRVKKVTHVINAADHFMDLELQSNAHKEP